MELFGIAKKKSMSSGKRQDYVFVSKPKSKSVVYKSVADELLKSYKEHKKKK